MELRDVIIFVSIMIVFTLIVAMLKMRKKQEIGYLSMTVHKTFSLKVGVINVDGSNQFSIIIENTSESDVKIKDMFIEMKINNRYQKSVLPKSVFDTSKTMIIPPGKTGAGFIGLKEFKKLFTNETLFKAVVLDTEGNVFKSNILMIGGKKMEISTSK